MEEVLSVQNLTKQYGIKTALNGLSVALEQGRFYGLIGPEGAGKTTLLRLLAGLCFPTAGSLSLFGSRTESQLRRARNRVGFLVETPVAVEYFSLRQNLELQAPLAGRRSQEGMKALRRTLGLTEREVGHRRFRDCAVWERQRYGLAAALLGDPELLVLDEPMNGLDPEGIRVFRELLGKWNRDRGVTVLIAASAPAELRGLATDYLFMDEGRLLSAMTAAELEQMLETAPEEVEKTLLRGERSA